MVFGGEGQMHSCSTKEAKVRIKYQDLWKDRAFAWTANCSLFFQNPNAWRHLQQIEMCIGGHPGMVPKGWSHTHAVPLAVLRCRHLPCALLGQAGL